MEGRRGPGDPPKDSEVSEGTAGRRRPILQTERGYYRTYDLPRRSRRETMEFGLGTKVRLDLEGRRGHVDFESGESLGRANRALRIGLGHFLGLKGSPGAEEFAEGLGFLEACGWTASRLREVNRSLFAEKGSDAISRLLVDKTRLGGTEATLLEIIGCGGTGSGSVTLWIPETPRVSMKTLSDLLEGQPKRLQELVLKLVGRTESDLTPRGRWGREAGQAYPEESGSEVGLTSGGRQERRAEDRRADRRNAGPEEGPEDARLDESADESADEDTGPDESADEDTGPEVDLSEIEPDPRPRTLTDLQRFVLELARRTELEKTPELRFPRSRKATQTAEREAGGRGEKARSEEAR